ncbi:MAG: hypothetical protein U9R00_02725 [Patescibacteria group bacterium]|nr:hypothetical protein [Patescibacteria group bacterium]
MNTETRTCQNCKKDFIIKPEDFSFYEKTKVPAPTFCPLCRAQRRMSWRNESSLFKRKSDYSKKEIFSSFHPQSPVKVYEKEIWNSDKWDPLDFRQDYDFSKPFFEQFKELLFTVPLKNLNIVNGVNSDYSNNFTNPKNCYLCFNGKNSEDCFYSNGATHLKDCIDTSHCGKSEKCYESFWLSSCSNAIFSSQCENSYNISFCRDCVGCNDCFGCVGLRNKSYRIFNKQYTKNEYQKKIKEFNIGSYSKLQQIKKEVKEFWQKFPKKYIEGYQNINVSGNYINHSKNVKNSSLIREGENLKYCQFIQELPGSKDCYDYTSWGDSVSLAYECSACGLGANNIKFCYNVQESSNNIEYSYMCSGSSDLFGCIGLKKKQYCIFNKQYTKEEYEELIPKIKQHMNDMPYIDKKEIIYKYGEFFPSEFSPFAYSETLAMEYFPLTKEQVSADNFIWRDSVKYEHKTTLKNKEIPDHIDDISDDITSKVIECNYQGSLCTKAFKITPDELNFYRKMNLPLPRDCFRCRSQKRLNQRTKLEEVKKRCQCAGLYSDGNKYKNKKKHSHKEKHCETEFITNYTDPKDLLYCEECYQQEVF